MKFLILKLKGMLEKESSRIQYDLVPKRFQSLPAKNCHQGGRELKASYLFT